MGQNTQRYRGTEPQRYRAEMFLEGAGQAPSRHRPATGQAQARHRPATGQAQSSHRAAPLYFFSFPKVAGAELPQTTHFP